jgi:Protein of unknown function (DUF692)
VGAAPPSLCLEGWLSYGGAGWQRSRGRAALDVLTARVRQVQAELDVPLALERVAYVHVAGGAEHAADPGVYHDTHTDPVPPAVLTLLERLRERLEVAPAVMLERDGRYPPAAALHAELDAIATAAALPPGHRGMTREFRGPAAGTAARQAELVAALVAGGPVPSGFDPDRLAVARRALLRKRAGEAAALWPLLAASLGSAWPEVFTASVAACAPAGALCDGWDLARELHRRGELGDAAAVELAECEVTLHRDGRQLPAGRRCASGVVVQLGGRVYHVGVR